MKKQFILVVGAVAALALNPGCKPKTAESAIAGDAASKVYVAPGEHDEFYNIVSGGFNGQMSVVGLPSGRVLKILPVFSVNPENGYGFSEESKPMLNTSNGFVPWDDLHHIAISQTKAEHDARWAFGNGNNTPRIARVDLTSFKTVEIIEIPNSAGNHSSPFITENTEYVVAGTRFSVPTGSDAKRDVPIASYKENFKGFISFIGVNQETGDMNLSFQIEAPPFNFDLARAGKNKSHGWFFFSTYNTEMAHTLLEVNASQKDKDFIMAVNWKKAEEYVKAGEGEKRPARYAHNKWNESTHMAESKILEEVLVLDPKILKDIVYFIPCPKSPHGTDTDPTGEYIIGSGKLAAIIPVFSFTKMLAAIQKQDFEGNIDGMPILKYESVLHGEVQKPGLGPLHTEFDGKGNAYTSMFVSSEIVKWNIETLQVLDRVPTFYSVGHLSIPGGPTGKPHGKYMVAYNKITKDRYLPTGPELAHSAQLYDITGDKMQLLLDFPTIGEPHYAESFPASLIKDRQVKFYPLEENNHPAALKGIADARVEKKGNEIHIYLTSIRSNFRPDNIEGVEVGNEVFFHMTNLEQDWDVPHGLAIKNANTAELLVMPGETATLKWIPNRPGIFPFYCTDFCSALHQEMQGYVRVSPKGSNLPLTFTTGE
ncbi:Sec-dependent nitrous-oxide reductase [Algoriphagus marinus]|uniref:Sec-dependent nitrous-oxide reductase n=1 Tax=Algoriphagus marinus TaxID=1925762 RepID=UPI00094BB3C2|nr:Sec-dependent nitrous-oxide reductase [Algoriphagus marinus]